jgi:hypothetical protein
MPWRNIATAPKTGETILLHFLNETPDVKQGRWLHRKTFENDVLIHEQLGWDIGGEVRDENAPDNWCEIAEPPPTSSRERPVQTALAETPAR